jgi:uncharacterized protein YdaU (DUF1376 family)
MHYYQFNIPDFALHTSHLTLEEEGVFRRLLDYYYDTESPIPKETQPVIRRLRLGSYQDIVSTILSEFFVLQEDGWHNLRADIEISDFHIKAEAARNNGRKGGRPKKNQGLKTQPVILANPEVTHEKAELTQPKANYELETINQELISNTRNGRSIDQPSHRELVEKGFAHFWKIWKQEKNRLGKVDTSPKSQTFEKKWKPMFNHSYWSAHTQDDYREKVNQICAFVVEAHSVEGFNRFENMQTGKFFTEKQWEDQ